MTTQTATGSKLVISVTLLKDPSHKCESCDTPALFSVCEEGLQWSLCRQHTERKMHGAVYLIGRTT